jgi:hypothetical protein
MNKEIAEEITGNPTPTQKEKSNIIFFPLSNSTHTTASLHSDINFLSNTFLGKETTTKRSPKRSIIEEDFKNIEQVEKQLLNLAFDKIVNTNDHTFDMPERSNCFDEWKDCLLSIARKVESLTINHRKLLGSMISITHKRDIVDFTDSILLLFQEATNVLRQPRINRQDSKRIINMLLQQKQKILIPLYTEHSDTEMNALNDMIIKLIEKSNINER